MNKNQARAMLAFIADLYVVIQTPDPPPERAPVPERAANGKGRARETQPVTDVIAD